MFNSLFRSVISVMKVSNIVFIFSVSCILFVVFDVVVLIMLIGFFFCIFKFVKFFFGVFVFGIIIFVIKKLLGVVIKLVVIKYLSFILIVM